MLANRDPLISYVGLNTNVKSLRQPLKIISNMDSFLTGDHSTIQITFKWMCRPPEKNQDHIKYENIRLEIDVTTESNLKLNVCGSRQCAES